VEHRTKGDTRVDHQKLTRFVSQAFQKLGVPENDAEIAAKVLVAADLRGVDTHGVIRFNPNAWYVKWLQEGSMNPTPNIRVVSENGSSRYGACDSKGQEFGRRDGGRSQQPAFRNVSLLRDEGFAA